jgi:hypothetical protein
MRVMMNADMTLPKDVVCRTLTPDIPSEHWLG